MPGHWCLLCWHCPGCCAHCCPHCCAHPAAVSALLHPLLSACLERNKIMAMPVVSGWNFVPFSIAGVYWSLPALLVRRFIPGGCVFPKPCWSLPSPHCRALELFRMGCTQTHISVPLHAPRHSFLQILLSFPPPFSAPCMSCYTLFLHA